MSVLPPASLGSPPPEPRLDGVDGMAPQAPAHKGKAIVHWTSATDAYARANAAYLAVAYCVVCLGMAPEEAARPIEQMDPAPLPFRDASYNNTCAYQLTVLDCARGLSQGMLHGWLNFGTFDIVECAPKPAPRRAPATTNAPRRRYEHYERVENGDLNWTLPGKFISFAGPHNEQKWDNGYPLLAPENYFDIFRKGGITDVIRLNNRLYDRERFVRAGFNHHDLFFIDGSIPPPAILKRFLEIAEAAKGGEYPPAPPPANIPLIPSRRHRDPLQGRAGPHGDAHLMLHDEALSADRRRVHRAPPSATPAAGTAAHPSAGVAPCEQARQRAGPAAVLPRGRAAGHVGPGRCPWCQEDGPRGAPLAFPSPPSR